MRTSWSNIHSRRSADLPPPIRAISARDAGSPERFARAPNQLAQLQKGHGQQSQQHRQAPVRQDKLATWNSALLTAARPGWVMSPPGLIAFASWNVLVVVMAALALAVFRRRSGLETLSSLESCP